VVERTAEASTASSDDDPAPLREVAGKAAFITGGSSGIGLGIAHACAAAGMRVMITYRTKSHMEAARACLEETGAEFHALDVNVCDREAMNRAASSAQEVLGPVHLLCHNAGVGVAVPISEATFDDWDFALGVNLYGVINGLVSFLPGMIAHREQAHVLAISSMSGLFHGGSAGVYTTTKFAVVGLMEALRGELAPRGIGVSVACPGLVATNVWQSERNRPAQLRNVETSSARDTDRAARFRNLLSHGMDPFECGDAILHGVRRNDLYILTHPEFKQGLHDRHEALERSMANATAGAPLTRLEAEQATLRHPIYMAELGRLSRKPL
jgi:NAD(P)-dependent dehydrogenase (short-subunit alcohol dehydrogenase family)